VPWRGFGSEIGFSWLDGYKSQTNDDISKDCDFVSSFLLGNQSGSGTPLRALVVDTDPKAVRDLAVAIQALGGQALEATTFEAAKRLWIAEKPPILIADIRLGPFNGLQLLLRAKSDRPDVIAAITSTSADSVLEVDTQRFGGIFLLKPLDPGHVLQLLLGQSGSASVARVEERRLGERRTTVAIDFVPERRMADRRLTKRT